METRKVMGGIMAIAGVVVFYSAFTDNATEWFSDWISIYAPSVKDNYSSSDMLMAWGGMLAGIGALLICKKR